MFRENIGENLRRIRKSHTGLSVAKVVDKINENGYELSVDTYYKWERGTRKPPCDAIPYIAEAFGISENIIFHLHESCKNETENQLDYLEGLYSSMEKRDQNLIQDLILRLYGDQKRRIKIF